MKRFFVILFLVIFSSFTCRVSTSIEEYFELMEQLKALDSPMSAQQPGDWLSQNPEPGQTFGQFIRTVEKPSGIKNKKIYIKPIGEFDSNQQLIVEETSSYLTKFYQCEVVVEATLPLKEIPRKAKRKHDGHKQLNTDYINYKVLYPDKPKDAIAYMAITTSDLYPSSDWNFVFGHADQINKVGVSSIARYDYPDDQYFNKTAGRIIKTSAHEIGHMLGVEHCISAACLMNGSNGLEESDSQPQTMCSECIVKLGWRTQIDLVKRDSLLSNHYNDLEQANDYNHVVERLAIMKEFLK